MGMDIVKRVLDQLGGELLMQTREGKGTALRAPRAAHHLPSSTPSASSASGRRFCRPRSPWWKRSWRSIPRRSCTPPRAQGGASSRRGCSSDAAKRCPSSSSGRCSASAITLGIALKALLVRRNHEPIAFGVDRMLGQQEVVVRPLEDPLVHVPGVAGATDLGDGQPTLVLDLPALSASLSSTPALESVA